VPGDIPRNVARHLQFGHIAADRGVQLLVFPELSLTGYELTMARSKAIRPDSFELDPLRHLAVQAHMTVVAGACVKKARKRRAVRRDEGRPLGVAL
jgi:predicted amidohydrolase